MPALLSGESIPIGIAEEGANTPRQAYLIFDTKSLRQRPEASLTASQGKQE